MYVRFKNRSRLILLPLVSVLIFTVALNFWVHQNPARIDLTSGHVYTPDSNALAVVGGLTKAINITFFYDVRSRAMQDARYLLEYYAQLSPFINLSAHDPVLEPAIAELHQVKFAGAAIFESDGRRIRLEQLDEVQFLNALIRVSSDAAGLVCFTDGHIESNPFSFQSHDHIENEAHGHDHSFGGRPLTLHERHGMGMAKNALETMGYKVEQRLLLGGPNALAGCSIVVVASPQAAFSKREGAQLDTYLRNGGHGLFMLEPFIESGLDELLETYGIAVSLTRIVDSKNYYWTDPGTPAVTNYERHRLTRNLPLSFFPGVAEIKPAAKGIPNDVSIAPLINTSEDSVIANQDESQARSRTIMALASREMSAGRIIVIGDGDFSTNSFFGALGNGQLFLNSVSELLDQNKLVDVVPRNYELGTMRLSNIQLKSVFVITIVVIPFSLAMIGLLIWRGRR